MTIYIGNLSFQAEQEDLLDLFGQYGEVKSASLPLDRETGRKRGFGFVEMATDEDEQKAIDDLQNVEWMGRMIRVNKATPRERTGGGGGGGGGPGIGNGGNGGSGVVILRMPTLNYTGTTTGSPTVQTDGSDTILTFTGSGTYTG